MNGLPICAVIFCVIDATRKAVKPTNLILFIIDLGSDSLILKWKQILFNAGSEVFYRQAFFIQKAGAEIDHALSVNNGRANDVFALFKR